MSIESVILSEHHPLPPPSFAFNLSQYQGLFQSISSLHQVAKVLELSRHLNLPPFEMETILDSSNSFMLDIENFPNNIYPHEFLAKGNQL